MRQFIDSFGSVGFVGLIHDAAVHMSDQYLSVHFGENGLCRHDLI